MSIDALGDGSELQSYKLFSPDDRLSRQAFTERVLIIVRIVTAVGLLLALLWYSVEVILLVFAGLLLAIFLSSIAEWINKHTPLSRSWALAIVLLTVLGLIALGGWLLAPTARQQLQQLSATLPQAIEQLGQSIGQPELGRQILERIPRINDLGKQSSNLIGRISGIFSAALGAIVNIIIVLVTGIYFAFNPKLYFEGATKLFPQSKQRRVRETLDTLNFTLRRWLLGRIAVMAANGILTTLGLWFLGVPFSIALGVLAGLLNFIPNIGPVLAAVPAILLAFTISPNVALYTVLLYLLIQNLDGFVMTPLVQQQTVSLPPVLVISSQLLLGILFGFLGIVLAVPIIAVAFVLIKMLYVEDTLGNQVEVKGEQKAKDKQQPQNC